jgi:type IV pilus assembly protein PilM
MAFFSKKELIGLDIGSGAIKLVQLKRSGRGYRLEKFGVKALDPELIVDGTVMDAGRVVSAIRELLREQAVGIKEVALSMSGHSVIVKNVTFPVMKEEEMEESIQWEAEQYIPFDIQDVNIDFRILGPVDVQGGVPTQMEVLLVAVKKDKLAEYTGLATEAGLRPVVVDVDAFALENMLEMNYEINKDEHIAILDVGAGTTTISVLKGGAFALMRDIPFGGNRYSETIQRAFGVDYEEAERIKRLSPTERIDRGVVLNTIRDLNMEFSAEVARAFDYFKTTSHIERVDRIFVGGGASKMPGLFPHLEEKMELPITAIDPFHRVQIPEKQFDLLFVREMAPLAAVGVGLAMRQGGDR